MEKDMPSAIHVPDTSASDKSDTAPTLKLDERGLPLVPQPSDHKDDPLVCPRHQTSEYESWSIDLTPMV
jgi:hypothetical protein